MNKIENVNIEKETVLLTQQIVQELIKNINPNYREKILEAFKEVLETMAKGN